MKTKMKQAGLVLVGALAGVLLSLNFSAVAQREAARFPLPVDELRAFAEVFGAIKSSYVEPVEDKKLITEAISGIDRKSTRLNSSHSRASRMPSSA